MSEISKVLDLTVIRYSRVWEDYRVLSKGLDIHPEDDVLSITSSGDNVLNMVLENPRSVTAIDMSPAQNAVLELKIAAIIQFKQQSEFLELIGVKPSNRRLQLYEQLTLPKRLKDFWDDRTEVLEKGLSECGKFDKYIENFQKNHLVNCVPDWKIDRYLNAKNIEEQRIYFHELPLAELKEIFCRVFGQKEVVKSGGRDPAQYKHTGDEEDIKIVWERFCHVCENVPVWENFYLGWFLRGSRVAGNESCINEKHPAYLKAENFVKLKSLVHKVHIVTDCLENYLMQCEQGAFSKANLSDLFEYLNQEENDRLFESLIEKCRENGRLAYWNLFGKRCPPQRLYDGRAVKRHDKLSERLHREDRLFWWSSFNIDEVLGKQEDVLG